MSSGHAKRRVDDEGTEADDESEIISVGGLVPLVGGCESVGVTFEEAVGELVSFHRQRLYWLPLDYRYVSFQTSQYTFTFY